MPLSFKVYPSASKRGYARWWALQSDWVSLLSDDEQAWFLGLTEQARIAWH